MMSGENFFLNGILSVIDGHFATVTSPDDIEFVVTKCPPITDAILFNI